MTENPSHRIHILGPRIEEEERVGHVKVGREAHAERKGMELGTEGRLAAAGSGREGGGKGTVIGPDMAAGSSEEVEAVCVAAGASKGGEKTVELEELIGGIFS